MRILSAILFSLVFLEGSLFFHRFAIGEDRTASEIEILSHEWRPDAVWDLIGKTKYVWKATVRNNSDKRKRVYVYIDLLDEEGVPLASAVANRFIEPHQTIEIVSDSYLLTSFVPKVTTSRAIAKIGFPN